jgi:hypothetical protein
MAKRSHRDVVQGRIQDRIVDLSGESVSTDSEGWAGGDHESLRLNRGIHALSNSLRPIASLTIRSSQIHHWGDILALRRPSPSH